MQAHGLACVSTSKDKTSHRRQTFSGVERSDFALRVQVRVLPPGRRVFEQTGISECVSHVSDIVKEGTQPRWLFWRCQTCRKTVCSQHMQTLNMKIKEGDCDVCGVRLKDIRKRKAADDISSLFVCKYIRTYLHM